MPESQHVEWKESWRDKFLRRSRGFANADGGVLVIGRNDKGVAVGVPEGLMQRVSPAQDGIGKSCHE